MEAAPPLVMCRSCRGCDRDGCPINLIRRLILLGLSPHMVLVMIMSVVFPLDIPALLKR